MTTAARTFSDSAAQFYLPTGAPFYEMPYADPKKGMRKATLADARKVGALPGPTAVLKCLAKPELQNWIVEQAVLAVLTTPRQNGESDDAFVHRVLHVEKVQDQERDSAAELGTAIHDACACYFTGQDVPDAMRLWVMPALIELVKLGSLVCCEKVLLGAGYGGRTDLILEASECWWIIDYKGTKKLPEKEAWPEHRLQLSAYAAAFAQKLSATEQSPVRGTKPIRCANCYISTTEQGKFAIKHHTDEWQKTYQTGFVPLLKVWAWMNNYVPPGLTI